MKTADHSFKAASGPTAPARREEVSLIRMCDGFGWHSCIVTVTEN